MNSLDFDVNSNMGATNKTHRSNIMKTDPSQIIKDIAIQFGQSRKGEVNRKSLLAGSNLGRVLGLKRATRNTILATTELDIRSQHTFGR